MAQGQLHGVVRYLRGLAGAPPAEPTDRDLLERFSAFRDEDAFARLVRRHGPLVWGVCQRVLSHRQDAEDAFQATFFVLARKAAAIRWRDSVSSWLHEVAFRLSNETRVKTARRCYHEQRASLAISQGPGRDHDVYTLLDEELHRLPDKYRAPLLLCYLQGRTSDQAAAELGWSLRTLQRRLAQGRELLRLRLTRRGVTLSGVLLLAVLTQNPAAAMLPQAVTAATTEGALAFAAGAANTSHGALLAQGFMKGIAMMRWKLAGTLTLVLAATVGSGVVVRQSIGAGAAENGPQDAASKANVPPTEPKAAKSEIDAFAGRLWDIIEVVSKQHLEPQPRAELMLAGGRAMLEAAKTEPPTDLERRTAAVGTREEFAAWLHRIWPADERVPRDKLEAAFLAGISKRVGGEVQLLPPGEMKIQEQISGNRYVGIGIQIRMHKDEDRAQIMTAMRRGAARQAGIKADDIILQVNGKDTKGVAVPKVVEWLRDEEGTKVTLTVKQPGPAEPRTYTLTRAVVPFDSLAGHQRLPEDEWNYRPDPDAPVAYVRLSSLRISTLQELRQLEPRLRAEGFRGLVLDLRFSSGDGLLRNAALFADGLLDGGLMWATLTSKEQTRTEFRADRECLFRDWPLAVLINETLDRQHALVAAALQDNGRAVLVGEPTKNDYYVNSVVALPDGKRGIIFRTGILERAAKERGWPVKPDHVVAMDAKAKETLAEWQRKQEIADKRTEGKAPPDPQLAKAVELIRDALKTAETGKKP